MLIFPWFLYQKSVFDFFTVKAGQYRVKLLTLFVTFFLSWLYYGLYTPFFPSRPVRTANVAAILRIDSPILMFSVQREDKGSVCTCAGEHLNKCLVFVQQKKTSTNLPFQISIYIVEVKLYIFESNWISF